MGAVAALALAVLCILVAEQGGGATNEILVKNVSTRTVTISWNASEAAGQQQQQQLVLAPGEETNSLAPGAYYFTNVITVKGEMRLDGFIYNFRNSPTHVGMVYFGMLWLANNVFIPHSDDF